MGLYTSCINPYGIRDVAFPPVSATEISTAKTPVQANKPKVRSLILVRGLKLFNGSKRELIVPEVQSKVL
jgi:hypothetical protein